MKVKGVTLIELLIAIVLLSMVVVGFFGIDRFANQQLLGTDRRARLQNEVFYVLSHMNKNLTNAIGDTVSNAVQITPSGTNTGNLSVTIDTVPDGVRTSADTDVRYLLGAVGGCAGAQANHLYFRVGNAACEELASHVRDFDVTLVDNYLNVYIAACWDPDGAPLACGNLDNPQVEMRSTIRMPSVSSR